MILSTQMGLFNLEGSLTGLWSSGSGSGFQQPVSDGPFHWCPFINFLICQGGQMLENITKVG